MKGLISWLFGIFITLGIGAGVICYVIPKCIENRSTDWTNFCDSVWQFICANWQWIVAVLAVLVVIVIVLIIVIKRKK